MGLDLATVCARLESDKVKERVEGIQAIRDAFSRDHVVTNFDDLGEGKPWISLFQSLFSVVAKEKQAKTAVAARRLEDAASTVRWLVERSLHAWSGRVRKPVLAHLRQSIIHRGRLLAPDYVKALRAIVYNAPHADSLDEQNWKDIFSLAFAILLDRPLNTGLYDEEEEDEDEDEDEVSTPEGDSRKRARSSAPPAKRPRMVTTAQTQEQIDSAAIVRALVRLRFMPTSGHQLDRILDRVHAFFRAFPTETTAHKDMVPALNTLLARAALNASASMKTLAYRLWDPLIALWATKERASKEAVLIALGHLFPFVDEPRGLVKLIDAEPDVRLGAIPVLALDSLQLHASDGRSFTTRTFSAGPGFSSGHALAWAALELLVDALASSLPAFLAALHAPSSPDRRHFRLQAVLFLVERHWATLPPDRQSDVIAALLPFLSHDDHQAQGWAFLALAAIAHSPAPCTAAVDWDTVWSHVIRRASVPAVCRSACHLAFHLLRHEKVSSTRVLADVEALAKDITLQGPASAHDSVCAFLSKCLEIARRDARLYRMGLEDQVLAWLSDVGIGGVGGASDILALLEGVCALERRSAAHISTCAMLPDCAVAETMAEAHRTAPLRDYMQRKRLPALDPEPAETAEAAALAAVNDAGDLVAPRPRERKASAFLLKALEGIAPPATAAHARAALDVAVLALCFEAALELNGTRPTRKVVQAACRVIRASTLDLRKWTWAERSSILHAFEPLLGNPAQEEQVLDILVKPGVYSGIERPRVRPKGEDHQRLQRTIWRSADVQDEFGHFFTALKVLLAQCLMRDGAHTSSTAERDADFAPRSSVASVETVDDSRFSARRAFINQAVNLVVVAPMLQSDRLTPTRDKDLFDLLLQSDGERLLLLGPPFCACVRSGAFHLTANGLCQLIARFGEEVFDRHEYVTNESARILCIELLDATLDIWLLPTASASETSLTEGVCKFFVRVACKIGKSTWPVRERWIAFVERCIIRDPTETFWNENAQQLTFDPPAKSIVDLMKDSEMLVRTRAVVASTSVLSTAPRYNTDVFTFYMTVLLPQLSPDVTDFESIISRILALANYMIVNSAVRRGPFWHLLEPLLYQGEQYLDYVQSVLEAVALRLGMSGLAALFEAYALQLAHSFNSNGGHTFFSLPAHVLGYSSHDELAKASYANAAPVLLLSGYGARPAFAQYCAALGISVSQGLTACSARYVGYNMAYWLQTNVQQTAGDLTQEQSQALFHVVRTTTEECGAEDPVEMLTTSLDCIISTIVQSLGDIDFGPNGSIVVQLGLQPDGARAVRVFNALMQYRSASDFTMHDVLLPRSSTATVIRAIRWLDERVPDDTVDPEATIYHVLHQLYAQVSSTPLLNEKLRVLHGICFWVAINSRKFARPALLRTLILGATVLLGIPDLSRFAQSIIAWAFSVYRSSTFKQLDPVFPDSVSRMGKIAYAFASDRHDQSIKTKGLELLDWLERQLEECAANVRLRDQVVTIVNLWPRRPQGQLVNLSIDSERTDTLATILGDPRLTSNKFRLLVRLRDFAQRGDYMTAKFSTEDFWRFKSCMPSGDALRDEDIDAFIDLLFMSQAQLIPVTDQTSNSTTIAHRHAVIARKQANVSAKGAIVQAVLAMLSNEDTTTVRLAYTTLRHAVPLLGDSDRLKSSDKDEMALFSRFEPLRNHRPQELTRLLTDPSYMSTASDFAAWIRNVCVLLADSLTDSFWGHMSALLQHDVAFAEEMFPVLVHASLAASSGPRKSASGVNSTISEYFAGILQSPSASTLSVRSIVRAVLHLRNFTPPAAVDVLAYDKWLTLDYDVLARGAISCGAYTTALLFLELSAEGYNNKPIPPPPEDILYEVYSRIDEPDGFYGIKSTNVLNHLVRRFHHEGEWDKAFHYHGATFEGSAGASDSRGILDSLHSFGFDNLAMSVLRSGSSSFPNDLQTSFEIGWRTDTWDLPEPPSEARSDMSLYRCLRAVHCERNEEVIQSVLSQSIRREMTRLSNTGDENLVQIREVTQTLMCLREIRQWRSPAFQKLVTSRSSSAEAWLELSSISSHFDFHDLERILAARMSLLRSVRHREQRDQMGNAPSGFALVLIEAEARCLVRLSEAARTFQHAQIALNAIVRAQQLERVQHPDHGKPDLAFDVAQEFSSVLWLQKEHKMAIEFLGGLLQQHHPDFATPTDDLTVNKQRATILSRVGGWASEARLQKPADIREHYFDPATNLLIVNNYSQANEDSISDPTQATIFYQCATFAEHHYQTILDSSEVIQLGIYKKRKAEELKLLQRQQTGISDPKVLLLQTRKTKALLELDSTQLSLYESTRDAFRSQAVEMFSRCLCASDEYDDDAVIRLCSIWTANFNLGDEGFHDVVQAAIERVPSRKFVFLAHQLSARLSMEHVASNESRSQQTLQKLMWRICSEHPFHSLYQLFSLQPAAGPSPPASSRRRSTSSDISPALLAREKAAKHLSNKLKANTATATRTNDVERLCRAFLEWATFPLRNNAIYKARGHNKEVPSHLEIRGLRDVMVPVPTIETPVDPLLRYDDIVHISRYNEEFNTAGGINLPKIIDCIGSDGRSYKQLFKGEGEDDLRQDAVMEQVFQLCNKVLKRDRETSKRKLFIRPYKVIPLSPTAGLLEFVTNTTPLGEWLPIAHAKYFKGDYDSRKAQDMLKQTNNIVNPSEKAKKLLDVFLKIRSRCRPVMRFFFRERHKDPMAWFAMRLNYARSAATTSIVGHVLGLGDRHISNILIDRLTGELVHIDLGIAFEQGKLLPMPETVPFRLTADMVDGLGTTGPEGVFRRCAEQTLRVLHDGSEIIKLVLEVFKHDPLHSWYASVKLHNAQRDVRKDSAPRSDRFGIGIDADSNPEVEAADRALSSVARKLDRSMSVEYTVNELITTAMDPANLSRIFWGWNPQF